MQINLKCSLFCIVCLGVSFFNIAASRTGVRERVRVSKEVRGDCVDMCGVCICVSEEQVDLAGVSGDGRSGSPGQGSPATAVGTPWENAALAQKPHHLEGESSHARSIASSPPGLTLDTTLNHTVSHRVHNTMARDRP